MGIGQVDVTFMRRLLITHKPVSSSHSNKTFAPTNILYRDAALQNRLRKKQRRRERMNMSLLSISFQYSGQHPVGQRTCFSSSCTRMRSEESLFPSRERAKRGRAIRLYEVFHPFSIKHNPNMQLLYRSLNVFFSTSAPLSRKIC